MQIVIEYLNSTFFWVGLLVGAFLVYLLWVMKNRQYDNEMAIRRREVDAQLAEAAALRANFDQRVHEAQLGVVGEVQELRDRLNAEQSQRLQLEANLATSRASLEPGFDHFGKLEEEARHRHELESQLAEERSKTAHATAHADAMRMETELLRSELNSRPHEVAVVAPVVAPVSATVPAEAMAPLYDAIHKLQQQTAELEHKRAAAHEDLSKQISMVAKNSTSPFKLPEARLNWGSMTLRQVAYQAGLSEGIDYTMSEEGMSVKLPNGRGLFVDGRLPLDHYAAALSADGEAERAGRLTMHNDSVKSHITHLGSSEFRSRFGSQPDFVVMFVPSESMYETALSSDSTLMQRALDSRVAIATPSTLVGLLQSVRVTMDHVKVTDNAVQVQKLAGELYDGLKVYSANLQNVGSSLRATTSAYNEALTSLDRDVLSKGRALHGLGTGTGDLAAGSTVELHPRDMPRVEYVNPLQIEHHS